MENSESLSGLAQPIASDADISWSGINACIAEPSRAVFIVIDPQLRRSIHESPFVLRADF
jgi:hypothetical protein